MRTLLSNKWLWCLWLAATLAGGATLASKMYISGDRSALLIGQSSSAHHQIELACDACHTSDFFASEKTVNKNMNKACLSCHKDELEVSNDSHPVKKFRDPRNISRREILDALYCVSCHVEHKPEITTVSVVTVPADYCSACHQDIADERPSHTDLGFETCASSGCHNYHDNTALYEQFLVKHGQTPWLFEPHKNTLAAAARKPHDIETALGSSDPILAMAELLSKNEESAASDEVSNKANELLDQVLNAPDATAPATYLTAEATEQWARSLHAKSGVNCTACHLPKPLNSEESVDLVLMESAWIEKPGIDSCQSCHKKQTSTFTNGKHGMRLHSKLPSVRHTDNSDFWSKIMPTVIADKPLEPMRVGEAVLPMKPDAHHRQTANCNACHAPHQPDLQKAAVNSCIGCHDDQHSNNYQASAHYELWQTELSGQGLPGTGVSCADCHMPKQETRNARGYFTTHNQNSFLRPAEKMIRPVCQNCHGLAFSIDALADQSLILNNFSSAPTTHILSIDWALDAQNKNDD